MRIFELRKYEYNSAYMTENKPADAPETPEREQVPETEGAAERPAPHKAFPNVADYLVFFGIFFVAQFIGAAVGWLVTGLPDTTLLESGDETAQAAEQLLAARFNALSFFVAMSLTLTGFLVYRARRGGPRIVARFSARGLNPVLLLWGVLLIAATSVILEPLLSALPEIPNVYGRGFWSLLTLVVMAPLFEEVIFRGVVLESTRARYGVLAAWLVSALVFGIVHVHPTIAVNAFAMGLVFGFIYLRSESLWSTIILHAINNGFAYILLLMGQQNSTLIDLIGSRTLYVIIYIAALAVFAASGYMVYRTLARLKADEKNRADA